MFQICVPNQKNSKKRTSVTFLKLFLNVMIRNIKIHNIRDIIENSNLWNLTNVLIKNNYEHIHLNISYDSSKFNGFRKIRV